MISIFTRILSTLCFVFFVGAYSVAQEQTIPRDDKDFRVELEPSSWFLKGFAASCTYNLTKWNDFNAGVYFASSEIPKWVQVDMFNNVGDTTNIRLGMEFALMARYKLNLFKKAESNPYVGIILGWEYFDIKQPNMEDLRITTGIATPYIGYEIYFYKQMLYLNPQLRGVYYFGSNSSDESRSEKIVGRYILPQLSLGIRL